MKKENKRDPRLLLSFPLESEDKERRVIVDGILPSRELLWENCPLFFILTIFFYQENYKKKKRGGEYYLRK